MSDQTRWLHHCAEAALGHWDVDVASIEFKGLRENATFRVVDEGGCAFALRIHRPGYHTIAELESEIEWTAALAAAGVDTPRPVPTRHGQGYAIVPYGDAAGETRHVGLIEWIDGEPLFDLIAAGTGSVELYHRLGELIARMHEQVDRFVPGPAFTRHRLDEAGLLGDDPWWGQFWRLPQMTADEADLIDAARARCRATLREYGTSSRTFGLIHADLHPENVLVHEGRPFAIDFDDAGFGWHQYDMAVALVAMDGTAAYRPHCDALVDGYRSVRDLSAEDLALLPTLVAARAMVTVGWVDSHVHDRGSILREYLDRAVRSCRALLDA